MYRRTNIRIDVTNVFKDDDSHIHFITSLQSNSAPEQRKLR